MSERAKKWARNLWAAIVTGAATAFLSALGITGANAVGFKVTQLDYEQLGVITLFGGIIGLASYLKQSPIPPEA